MGQNGGAVGGIFQNPGGVFYFNPTDEAAGAPTTSNSTIRNSKVYLDLSRQIPVADEVRPASISALVCITY